MNRASIVPLMDEQWLLPKYGQHSQSPALYSQTWLGPCILPAPRMVSERVNPGGDIFNLAESCSPSPNRAQKTWDTPQGFCPLQVATERAARLTSSGALSAMEELPAHSWQESWIRARFLVV